MNRVLREASPAFVYAIRKAFPGVFDWRRWLLLSGIWSVASWAYSDSIENENHSELALSNIVSLYQLLDVNSYACEAIDVSVIEHILKTGRLVTDRDIHDDYSWTGCSISGTMHVDGVEVGFSFDYGGILELENGLTLGCGEGCCDESYPYCSWDKYDLKGI